MALNIISIQKETKNLEVNETALETLLLDEAIKDLPVTVICVAGVFRKGKSFLLNFFLNYLSLSEEETVEWLKVFPEEGCGFDWKAGDQRVTTGISFWNKLFVRTVNGKKVAILLVDTQGTFDNQSTMQENVRIFSLGALLSSLLINNVAGQISEDVLQQLQLFVEFGRMIKQKDPSHGALQDTCFLVRDWEKPRSFAFGAEGGKSYLDSVLKTDDKPDELVKLRLSIRDSFTNISCVLFPNPGLKFIYACEGAEGCPPLQMLEEDFITSLRKFVPSIVEQCANVFNSGEMPKVETLFSAMARVDNLTVKVASLHKYVDEMKAVSTGDYVKQDELEKVHESALFGALQHFTTTQKLGAPEFAGAFRAELQKDIQEKYQDIKALNAARRGSKLTTLFVLLAVSILSNVLGTILSFVGLSPIAALLSAVTWLSAIGLLVWLYCHVTGEFREFRDHLDAAVDLVLPRIMALGAQVVPHVSKLKKQQ